MNHQPPDITNELIIIIGMLFVFCAAEVIFTQQAVYMKWTIIFGIILGFLFRARR